MSGGRHRNSLPRFLVKELVERIGFFTKAVQNGDHDAAYAVGALRQMLERCGK